jgi:hypothetical protein
MLFCVDIEKKLQYLQENQAEMPYAQFVTGKGDRNHDKIGVG